MAASMHAPVEGESAPIDSSLTPNEAQEALATALAKVRRLKGSALDHQAKPATLLIAIEETLAGSLGAEDKGKGKEVVPSAPGEYSATAYFVAILQCLNKSIPGPAKALDKDISNTGGMIPALMYLLAIVLPYVPRPVVLSHLGSLLPVLAALYPLAHAHAPPLRSVLQCTTAVFAAAPPATLTSTPLLKRIWNAVLELVLDPRPKIRHLAHEAVRRTLMTPTPPRLVPGAHPYTPRAVQWALGVLAEEAEGKSDKGKKAVKFVGGKGDEDGEGKRAMWIVQGLKGWVGIWDKEHLSQLCPLLLSLPSHPHLTAQVYALLSHLLAPNTAPHSSTPLTLPNLPTILSSLLASPPHPAQALDCIEYTSAVAAALTKLARQDPAAVDREYLSRAWNTVWTSILVAPASAPNVRAHAADQLGAHGMVRYALSDRQVELALEYKRLGIGLDAKRQKMKAPLLIKMIAQLENAIATLPLMLPYLLPILTAMISRLRRAPAPESTAEDEPKPTPTAVHGQSKSDAPATALLLSIVVDVADLRVQPGFEHKDKVDDVVGMTIEVMGVKAVLDALPLNVEPDATGKVPSPGRAHLLPILRSRVTNDSIAYFTTALMPVSERLFERKVSAEQGGRAGEAKVREVVIGQIWDCLPGFFDLARDTREGLTTPFAQLISQLLYTQPLLRPSLLRALSTLITSHQTLSRSAAPSEELLAGFGIDQQDAAQNITFLRGLASEMLAVLFNVFSSVATAQRGMVGDVVALWMSIMAEKDVVATFDKVQGHLKAALAKPTASADPNVPPPTHTLLDLLIIMIPYLPQSQVAKLFSEMSSGALIESPDAAVQKKVYRILARLIETGKAIALNGEGADVFVKRLVAVGESIGPGAQRDRMLLLTALVPTLPDDRLHLVPTLITEAVLGTKEVNEKARNAAFDLLIVMGTKMRQGGKISRKLAVGMTDDEGMGDEEDEDEEDAEMADDSADATVEEYITMVAAGLAAATPHMISASITALSRLLFEYQEDLSANMIDSLVSTIVVFVASKNREIVKSALGFVKVAVVSLPAETMRPHLPALVPALLGWVHDHKNHFKTKTVHIFERMIRKFGYDDVYAQGGEGDRKKVLESIKKKKDRAKRQKANKAQGSDDEDEPSARKTSTGSAFEDALYGSESEDDDAGPAPSRNGPAPAAKNRKDRQNAAYIQEDADEPMDLLDRSIAGRVSAHNPANGARQRKPGQEAADFKTDKDTGRMVIEEDEEDDAQPADNLAGAAYQSNLTSVDGVVRDARGNLKFNKNTKRGRALEEDNDVDMLADVPEAAIPRKKPKTAKPIERLGSEFRSKKAGGDIKRKGQADPYSYVSLSAASKKRGNGPKVSLTNKKKGSRQG